MSVYELRPDGTLEEVDLKRADLVAVVRCMDCKHLYENKVFGCHECMRDDELYVRPKVEPDGFCKWGERK